MSAEAAARAGHFTSMQVRGGRVQGLDLHLTRLVVASRELYGRDPGQTGLARRVREALAGEGLESGDCTVRVRVLPADSPERAGASNPDGEPPLRIEVDVEPPRQPSGRPLRVRTHPGTRSCPSVKHLDLQFQREARSRARSAGFDDALLLAADGRIAEGTFWNICFWDGTGVVWPDGPALAGVTRQLLAGALEGAGVAQARRRLRMDSLPGLAAAFALNSTGIVAIAEIDPHAFRGDPEAEALLRRLLAGVPADPP